MIYKILIRNAFNELRCEIFYAESKDKFYAHIGKTYLTSEVGIKRIDYKILESLRECVVYKNVCEVCDYKDKCVKYSD